ncbi:alkaline phosphatase-like protein, partial [Leptotrombidium deliense]
DAEFWYRENRILLQSKVKHAKQYFNAKTIGSKAKNVIFFLGDGMGLTTITSARIYMNRRQGTDPLFDTLSYEKFPFTGLVKVNNLDKMVSDSAAAATSYLRGVKTNYGVIGCTGKVKEDDCYSSKIEENRVDSILDWAIKEGKSAGFVTTTDVTHATPAGSYAHTAQRDWRSSAPEPCLDVAQQLIHGNTGKNLSVIFGGGRERFYCKNCAERGNRRDNRDLVQEWLNNKKNEKKRAKFITTANELQALDTSNTDTVMGLFASEHMEYNLMKESSSSEPSITQMTMKALEVLQKNKNGGRIDLAHHKNRPRLAIDETFEMHKAVQTVLEKVNLNDTLIVVTADHSQTLAINGQFGRGDGLFDITDYGFSILTYGNGPGYKSGATSRKELRNPKASVKSAGYTSLAKHGGEDVPIYAVGPGAHLLTGVFDQTFIAHAISYVCCIGPQKQLCDY